MTSSMQPLAVSVPQAAALIGVSTSTYYREAAAGRLPLVRISPRRSVVPMAALVRVINKEVEE